MSLFITDQEHAAIAKALVAGADAQRFFAALVDRALSFCARTGIVQDDDTMEWRHIVWERLSDAAFAVRFAEQGRRVAAGGGDYDQLTRWLHDTTMEIVRYERDEWIGPWFRARLDPPQGQLETAHVALGVGTVYDLCPQLFGDAELDEIRVALRDKGQYLTRNWLDSRISGHSHINNWFMVLLGGYVAASALIGDTAAVRQAADEAAVAASVYNADSYGESPQYWNYATIHLAHIVSVVRRYAAVHDPAITLDPAVESSYTACLEWLDATILGIHDVPGWGSGYANSVNFGDSSHMFRPTADVLLQVAAAGVESAGRGATTKPGAIGAAGTARRLFDTLYADPTLEPVDRQTFGFFNTYSYRTVLFLALEEAARDGGSDSVLAGPTPALPVAHRFYENGDAILRPSAAHPDSVLAFHGEHAVLNASSHRHEDLLSFQLFFRGERLFTDPGHCCYRLATQRFSKSTAAHSTLSFETASGVPVTQTTVSGNVWAPGPILAKATRLTKLPGGGIIVGCDAAAAYGEPLTRVERIFVYPDEHTVFIVDVIEAAEPVTVAARFVVNNRDNRMTYNHPAWDRTVIRRDDAAAKLFHLAAQSRSGTAYAEHDVRFDLSWGYQHDVYHPQPNMKGQGREGSTVAFSYVTSGAAASLRLIHGVAMDEERSIRQWHFRTLEDGSIHVEPPSHEGGWALKLDDLGFQLVDVGADERYTEAL